ncbi:Cytochrome protein, partial [Ophiophagus hannah]
MPSGIILSNGHTWKQQRHIGITSLRKLGLGKKSIEHQIEDVAQMLVEIFRQTKGQPFDPSVPVLNAVSNIICALSFGHQFVPEDENFQKLTQALKILVNFTGNIFHMVYALFPRLMNYLPGPHKKALASMNLILAFAKQEIEKHKESHCLHEPQDFIDHYLLQIEKSRNDPNSTYNEENLAQCILDFFAAGTESTSTTMIWALLVLTNHPDIQGETDMNSWNKRHSQVLKDRTYLKYKSLKDELNLFFIIIFFDQKKLPYTNAVIHEMQRLKYAVLIGAPRQSTKDVKIRGYHIPKGTIIGPDLLSVLHDPEQWETPKEFNPNHFLDKDGKFTEREEFLPFGTGQRACVGEQLARIELFIFLTSLLRAFSFQLPEGVKEVNEEPVVKTSMHPHPYKLYNFGPKDICLLLMWLYLSLGPCGLTGFFFVKIIPLSFIIPDLHLVLLDPEQWETSNEFPNHFLDKDGKFINREEFLPFEIGIILSNGHIWKQQRHIGVTSLRKLGLGKKSIEHQIEGAAQTLVEIFRQTEGQPFDPSLLVLNAVCNIICVLSCGHQFAPEDENFQKLTQALKTLLKFIGDFYHTVYDTFPWLMKYLPGPHTEAIASMNLILSFAKQEIEKHKESHCLHEPQDFIDYYLLRME